MFLASGNVNYSIKMYNSIGTITVKLQILQKNIPLVDRIEQCFFVFLDQILSITMFITLERRRFTTTF